MTNTHETIPNAIYLSTAIPFVNAPPHIGHALGLVLADALRRYYQLRGAKTWSQSGTDDNSLKNARAAEEAGVSTSELVARNAREFARLVECLDVHLDNFIRTSTDPRHRPAVHEVWRRCLESGDITKKIYRGLYCVGCEHFLSERELKGGSCPEHGRPPEVVEEENYFFRLSRYEETLRDLVRSGRLRIEPPERAQEVLTWLDAGLEDFSISRSRERARGWGIEVPGAPAQIIYVWFDALANYISALGWPEATPVYGDFWETSGQRTHVIGKGILRFHAVYWPAILLSAGLPLPTQILSHGYVTVEGQKIGKSLGNAIDPFELVDAFGSDSVRWYLLRHIHTTKDGDVSRARLVSAHNADLADGLGNLWRRVLTLIEKHRQSRIPSAGQTTDVDTALVRQIEGAIAAASRGFESFRLHEASEAVATIVTAADRYTEKCAPWQLAKKTDEESVQRLDTVLYHLAEALRILGVLCEPFLPQAARAIATRLGTTGHCSWSDLEWGGLAAGTRVTKGEPLFGKVS